LKPGLQEVGKKEDLQDEKYDKKFNQDNDPQFPADGHGSEAVSIKSPDAF